MTRYCLFVLFTEGLVWFVKFNNPRPWTKEPLQRQSLSVAKEPWVPNNRNVQTASERRGINDICEAFNEATGRTNYTPSLQVSTFTFYMFAFVLCSIGVYYCSPNVNTHICGSPVFSRSVVRLEGYFFMNNITIYFCLCHHHYF